LAANFSREPQTKPRRKKSLKFSDEQLVKAQRGKYHFPAIYDALCKELKGFPSKVKVKNRLMELMMAGEIKLRQIDAFKTPPHLTPLTGNVTYTSKGLHIPLKILKGNPHFKEGTVFDVKIGRKKILLTARDAVAAGANKD
jgi:hypothetical protein